MQSAVIVAAMAFGLSLVLVRLLASAPLARFVLDIPNDRSLHDLPIPRTGGVGIMLAAAVLWLLASTAWSPGWMQGHEAAVVLVTIPLLAFALAAVFLVDDVRGLPVPVRFGVQLAAAAAFVWGTRQGYPALLLPCLVIGIVWSANLYNFMDGSNGLAGGMAVAGFGTYAAAALPAGGEGPIAVVSAALAGAAAGFLVWNFGRAIIFLGDAGSIPLGFLAAVLGLAGWQRGVWPFWLPFLVFSPFVIDASLTLLQRWQRGERLSEAHKSHYYQRLVRMGWSHRRLALSAYGLMLATSLTALALRTAHPVTVAVGLGAWVLAYVLLAVAIDRKWVEHCREAR